MNIFSEPNNKLVVYHGNKDRDVIPTFRDVDAENSDNDYGCGFYTTFDMELAKEWACSAYTTESTGYVHKYILDLNDLSVLYLNKERAESWLAELINHRGPRAVSSRIAKNNMAKFVSKYRLTDIDNYDVIIGNRADDSFFSYIKEFINNNMYLEDIEEVIKYGDLGDQLFVKSEKAFRNLVKVDTIEVSDTDYTVYNKDWIVRDLAAKQKYVDMNKRLDGTLMVNML